jgi:hypothetical protein
MKTCGGSGGTASPFLTSELHGGEWTASLPGDVLAAKSPAIDIG